MGFPVENELQQSKLKRPFLAVKLLIKFILKYFSIIFQLVQPILKKTESGFRFKVINIHIKTILTKVNIDHYRMILCLAAVHAHASVFTILIQIFFLLNQRAKLSCVLFLLQHAFLATFCLILLHLSIHILTLEIRSFKPSRYTWEFNN